MAIQFLESVECTACGTLSRGVQLPGGRLCLDCCSNDPELVKQIIHHMNPELAAKLDQVIDRLVLKKEPMQ